MIAEVKEVQILPTNRVYNLQDLADEITEITTKQFYTDELTEATAAYAKVMSKLMSMRGQTEALMTEATRMYKNLTEE